MVSAMSNPRDGEEREPKEESADVLLSNPPAAVGVRVYSEVVEDQRDQAADGQVLVGGEQRIAEIAE